MTKQDAATAGLGALKASPWLGVVTVAFALGVIWAKGNSRLEATEDDVRMAKMAIIRLTADMDTVKVRQAVSICAQDPTRLRACELYTTRTRLP